VGRRSLGPPLTVGRQAGPGGACDAGDDRQGPTVIDRDHSGVPGGPKLFKRGSAFESADLGEVLGVLGPRGYRAAHVEAGIVHGRLLPCAHALANGATGLTFFDEAVRGAFETTASWLLVTAVGAPACRSRPSGWSRHPVELAG
jgi:hypothetical protein